MEAVKKLKGEDGTPSGCPGPQQSDSDSSSCEETSETHQHSDSEPESSDDSQMEFQMEFEARGIDEDDYHGIRRLIQQLFQEADIDLSSLTELAIQQSGSYGSTVKLCSEEEDVKECGETEQEEENHVYGVTTFIPITQNKDLNCIQQLMGHLQAQCKLHCSSELEQLSELLQDMQKPVGLLINERFLNLPVQLGSLVLQSLVKEMNEAMPSGHCEVVMIVARSHMIATTAAPIGHKRKDRDAPPVQAKQLVFDYFENEYLMKDCILSFSYPLWKNLVQTADSGDTDDIPFRTVIILSYSKFQEATIALQTLLEDQ